MRETIATNVLNQWKGVNQRLQPTVVPDGFFTFAKGIYFGLGENATRIEGKQASGYIAEPVVQITVIGQLAMLQTLNAVKTVLLSDLINFTVTP